MSHNPYDQSARYWANLDPAGVFAWLMGLSLDDFAFERWLNTRMLPFPGDPERTCDTVAFLRDLGTGGEPWAVVLEFQMTPDGLMFGRLLVYLGQLWQTLKPYPERGDRFNVAALVVNLTGKGNSGRAMRWSKAGVGTSLERPDRNLSEYRAEAVMTDIEAGKTARVVLGLIPLMQGGGEDAIIARWKTLVEADPRRRDLAMLVLIFAEATGCAPAWKEALKEWDVIQSPQVLEWQADARVEMLLEALRVKFGPLPEGLTTTIQKTTDPAKFKQWMGKAIKATTLQQFCEEAGLPV